MNNRRKLVIALGAGALAALFGSLAQQQAKSGASDAEFREAVRLHDANRGIARGAARLFISGFTAK